MVIACITVVPEHVVCEIATPVTDTDTQTDRYTDRPSGKQTDTGGHMQCRLMH